MKSKHLWYRLTGRPGASEANHRSLPRRYPGPKLISVHFPKAAGSSLIKAYENAFGPDYVCRDDENDPLDPCGIINLDPARYEKTKPTSLGHYAVAHGLRVVALREPVDNVISFYYYWRLIADRADPGYKGHGLYRHFCDAQPSLFEFAAIPSIRYLMTRVYFRDVDMTQFDAIGDYVDLNRYLQQVASLTGIELGPLPRVNVTESSDERRSVLEDARVLAKLRDLLSEDSKFYERYCRR